MWSDFYRFETITGKYLPPMGEGTTKASQIVTAVCKLVYKWFNDGDTYDNQGMMQGWCNDLSDYANWLDQYAGCGEILKRTWDCCTESDYEHVLYDLCEFILTDDLETLNEMPAEGSVYDCTGRFIWEEQEEEEDEYWDDEKYYDEEDE